jgi:penicillin-binding protein 1C
MNRFIEKPGYFLTGFFLLAVCVLVLGGKTAGDLLPLPDSLVPADSEIRKPQFLDRNGTPLSVTYQNRWSLQTVPLHQIPVLLQQAFIESEDRRFYSHVGVDWSARFHALVQNLRAMKGVRGASTITEQVVRMLHPRPRTVWSRWLEGFEASRLESKFSKSEILEFYLNQVPYGHQRRGVVEAARFYFDRDLSTLNPKENLALAVLVRAPSGLDLKQRPRAILKRLTVLAAHMKEGKFLSEQQYQGVLAEGFDFAQSRRIVEAPHFVQFVHKSGTTGVPASSGRITTTLDGTIQQKARQILRNRLEALKTSEVGDGAVLVVDSASGEVFAWVSESPREGECDGWVDVVTTPRQPGSTLKPFLYALAMEMGWNPATVIEDAPLAEPAGSGLHNFHNYSRQYYGPIRLRDALGNSLNTPAVRTIQFTGTERFLERLHLLGITSLSKSAEYYGQGLALGDGELSLYELVQAYSVLARGGEFRPLRILDGRYGVPGEFRLVMDSKTTSLIADILADPQARKLEFGEGHLLRFPVQTAVKTGTSTDHRDSWAVGFNGKYTAGVWMGNLDRRPTKGVTGAIGPALVLRSVFAELNRDNEPKSPVIADGLRTLSICAVTGLLAGSQCPNIDEKFVPGNEPGEICSFHGTITAASVPRGHSPRDETVRLLQPTPGLQIAVDPRIPMDLQAFAFKISRGSDTSKVEWMLNGEIIGRTGKNEYQFLWPITRGSYLAKARIWREQEGEPVETPQVAFVVK